MKPIWHVNRINRAGVAKGCRASQTLNHTSFSTSTVKKPEGVFEGCCPINDNYGILLYNFNPGGSLIN
jgi:hypothetical protein